MQPGSRSTLLDRCLKSLQNTVKHMNLPTVVYEKLHNLCKILHKLCNFSYTTVGLFICFTVLYKLFKQRSNSVV